MTPVLIIAVIFVVILLIVSVMAVVAYNNLISLQQKVKEAASDIDVQLKRRYDLIPNLVESVKGSANFEKSTLENVIKARQQAVDISGLTAEKAAAENMLSGALRQLFALSESYPDLKSNQNFLALQEELTNTEDRILASRRFYNAVVSDYNTLQSQFPTLLFKGLANAKDEPFFELEDPEVERKNVKVQF
jgi:LemA protein